MLFASFQPTEGARYARQIALPEIGHEGQRRLGSASVALIGVGGLGAPASIYLAAAGIGRIRLIDPDLVEVSNLHRQVIYDDTDVGQPKVEAAAHRLAALNPHVCVDPQQVRVDEENARDLISGYDVVIDGTDAFASRYIINDACVETSTPNVSATVNRFEGQLSVYAAPGGPCYRCLFPSPPPANQIPSCEVGGVIGVVPGVLGVLQATEAIKLLLGIGEPLIGRLLLLDMLAMRTRTLRFEPEPGCPSCGHSPHPPHLRHTLSTSRSSSMASVPEITVRDYERLRLGPNPPFLLDVRRQDEFEIANLDGALIPLDELPGRLDEIEPHRNDEILVVHCRSGVRSARAVEILQRCGYNNAVNLRGGILAWSDEVDPSVMKY